MVKKFVLMAIFKLTGNQEKYIILISSLKRIKNES